MKVKTDNKTLLGNITTIKKQNGLQMKDVASKMGITPESLSRSIHGNPSLSTLHSIADALDVPVSHLLSETVNFNTAIKINQMNAYKINSDLINDPDIVIASDANSAIEKYCKKYQDNYMEPENILTVERIAEKVLV